MISSPLTLALGGAPQRFLAIPTDGLPGQRFCSRCGIQLLTAGASVYIGTQGPQGVSDSVSPTVFNILLNDSQPTATIGLYEGNDVDLCLTWWDGTTGAQIAITPMQGSAS